MAIRKFLPEPKKQILLDGAVRRLVYLFLLSGTFQPFFPSALTFSPAQLFYTSMRDGARGAIWYFLLLNQKSRLAGSRTIEYKC